MPRKKVTKKTPEEQNEVLEKAVSQKPFEPYLRYVRFPNYKNVDPGTQIDFPFPVTALLGPNGTNKTSILRAIEACPEGKDLSDYWFETSLDPFDSDAGAARYIHGYTTPSRHQAEVIKGRVYRANRKREYFETQPPRLRDGMKAVPRVFHPDDDGLHNQTRWKPINKNVVYLDFRQSLPAYDILMNFTWRGMSQKTTVERKRLIRQRSKKVKTSLEQMDSSQVIQGTERVLEGPIELSGAELSSVSTILGRNYKRIRLVKHDLFNVHGWTALLESNHRQYSEAYAGSGEFAAVMMVHRVSTAPQASLIILDEPETSLHPGAQEELIHFLKEQSIEKKHQIVMATHSLTLVKDLPDSARVLLGVNESTGKVEVVRGEATLRESFSRLGARVNSGDIVVEDRLASELVSAAARRIGRDMMNSINPIVVPGGAETIRRRLIPTYSTTNSPAQILLDGDKRPGRDGNHSSSLTEAQRVTEIEEFVRIKNKDILKNGGNGDQTKALDTMRSIIIDWNLDHVYYLPTNMDPDQMLWKIMCSQDKTFEALESSWRGGPDKYKRRWVDLASHELGKADGERVTSDEIFEIQKRCIAKISEGNAEMEELMNLLSKMIGKV